MLKRSSIRRIVMASTALFILSIIYLFPSESNEMYKTTVEYVAVDRTTIYLIDNNNYVARTNMVLKKDSVIEQIEQIIESLTINGLKKDYIPNGFSAIIPKNTKVLDLSLQDKLLKIDFSNEFLNISKEIEEKLIESIIFSLTDINEVENIIIFVEGKQLIELPDSKRKLPPLLNKSYGINKVYEIDSIKETTKTTIYYVSKYNDNYYYVPVTLVSNDSSEKIEIIIESLKSSPIYQTNLMSYLAANAQLLDYEILEESINLSFNNFILNNFDNNSILEEVKYAISLSIAANYNVGEVVFLVDNEKIVNFILE